MGKKEVIPICVLFQIIIDDVQSGLEPEIIIPLSVYQHVKQVVLFGDDNQLGPCVENKIAKASGLGRSVIKSYLSTAVYLNDQFRVVSSDDLYLS